MVLSLPLQPTKSFDMSSLTIPVTPFQGDPELPQKADVVVVGGGIIGVTTAMELAERGISVAICEKGVIAGEQSSRNWGWTRQMGRDERELPLCIRSVALWAQIQEGERYDFRTGGYRIGFFSQFPYVLEVKHRE
mgnify:CR=1 FL=1